VKYVKSGQDNPLGLKRSHIVIERHFLFTTAYGFPIFKVVSEDHSVTAKLTRTVWQLSSFRSCVAKLLLLIN